MDKERLDKLWERIEYLMNINGLTQAYINREMGTANFFQKRGTNITMKTLFRVADVMGYPVEEFFKDDEEVPLASGIVGHHECYSVSKTNVNGITEVYGVFMSKKAALEKIKERGATTTFSKHPNKFLNPIRGTVYTIKKTKVHYGL